MNVTSYHLLISDARLVDDDVYQCQVGATDSTAGMRSRTAHLTVQSNHLNKRTCCSDVILNYSEKLATTVAMACKLIQKSCYGFRQRQPWFRTICVFISPRRQQHTSTYRHKLKTIKERTHRTQSKNTTKRNGQTDMYRKLQNILKGVL